MAIKLQPGETRYQVVYKSQAGTWDCSNEMFETVEDAEARARTLIEWGKASESQIQSINRYMSFSLFVMTDAKPEENKEGAD